MTREEAILYLEHTSSDDFNLEEHQIQNRLNAIQFLLKENQELKEKFKATNKGLQKTVLKRKKWKYRYQLARFKIKELERIIELCHLDAKETLATINYEQESQQKEFIKYLEDMLDDENDMFSVVRVKDVLQKYIEIVNGSEQN